MNLDSYDFTYNYVSENKQTFLFIEIAIFTSVIAFLFLYI